MTVSEFVRALKIQTSDAAVFGTTATLNHPPGRKPSERDIRLSEWYRDLADSDRKSVTAAMSEAAELAVFSFLCVLDGVSAIEGVPEKGELRLIYAQDGKEVLLNDPAHELLHDTYNSLCRASDPLPPDCAEGRAYEVASNGQLRAKQTRGDGLDLHVMASNQIGSADSEAPAIALPKNEHRKL
ncbi:MAG: hypothetical protein ABSG96_07055 [Terracidiphilus sp.]|jgi:hypothetical protein